MKTVSWFFLVIALALLNWGLGMISLRSFLAGTPAIATPLDLESFAGLVRRHRVQALLQAGLRVAGISLGVYVLARGLAELPLVLALNGMIFIAGTLGKPLEERARSLNVMDPLLEERYRAICLSWVKRPFPDFNDVWTGFRMQDEILRRLSENKTAGSRYSSRARRALLAACFLRSSERLYGWLLNHRRLGRYVRQYRKNRAIPMKAKLATLAFSGLAVVTGLWLRLLLLAVGIGVTLHLLAMKTLK